MNTIERVDGSRTFTGLPEHVVSFNTKIRTLSTKVVNFGGIMFACTFREMVYKKGYSNVPPGTP